MKICGIDASINGTGIVKFELDDDLEITKKNYKAFTQVKKYEEKNIVYHKKNQFKDQIVKNTWMINHIMDLVIDCDYVALEGYAYGAKGLVFNIAEFTGCLKDKIYHYIHPFNQNIKMRIYDPGSIKILGCGKGSGDKISMGDAYVKEGEGWKLDNLTQYKSPKSDIIDAWYIAKLLLLELKLRKGIIQLKDLDEAKIRIMNRVTRANPTNILDTDFISRGG